MRAILIDNEVSTITTLEKLLCEISNIQIIGRYTSPKEAFEMIRVLEPDVIFLTTEMRGTNGIHFAKKILSINLDTHIIFLSNERKYAVHAFEIEALDYLLKPITKERLLRSIRRLYYY
ncbi:MAG TPA: response regulator [Cerasibacillus sp.]|uniref:LytR/AlgR family response regulator transcription factor n=1 Tax=Cerasibacillus sp. TaxID=2498711 RepID=UPI002F420140